jgi:hypothetical protein
MKPKGQAIINLNHSPNTKLHEEIGGNEDN